VVGSFSSTPAESIWDSSNSKSSPMMLSMASAAVVGGLHHLGQLVVFGNDPVHAHLGGELDFFGGLLVGWVGGGDDQPVVALAQHDHAVGLADLGVQQVAGSRCVSMASRSSSGAPNADDIVCANRMPTPRRSRSTRR
jgi:hypothetical protein